MSISVVSGARLWHINATHYVNEALTHIVTIE